VQAALAEVAAVEAATAGGSVEEEEAWLHRHDAACARVEAAVEQAMGSRVPDLEGFVANLGLLFAHGVEPGAIEDGWVEAIGEDGRRPLRGS